MQRLRIDERSADDAARVLHRYLDRERIRSGDAHEDAIRDYRDLASRREASRIIPEAWKQLVSGPEDLLIELVSDQAEAMCGFRPSTAEVLSYLRELTQSSSIFAIEGARLHNSRNNAEQALSRETRIVASAHVEAPLLRTESPSVRSPIIYYVFGQARSARNAQEAFVDVLRSIAERFPRKIDAIAEAARGRTRNHIARTVEQIYPERQDLARSNAAEILPGWLVGLNVANREKVRIIRSACDATGLRFGSDVRVELPNS